MSVDDDRRITTPGARLAPALLLAVSVVGALPPLLNAAGTQSDAAVVGLQAIHFLRGERSWFLWGSGYQSSVDSWVAAQYFRVFGPTPLALMASAFVGYLALTAFAYATVRRRFEPWSAALLVLPLVIMAGPVHIYAFYPPRQAALTLLFLAIFVVDGADGSSRRGARTAAGTLIAGLSCFADPYCLLFLPAMALFVVLSNRDDEAHRFVPLPIAAGFAALAIGLVPFAALFHSAGAKHAVYGLTSSVLVHNLRLLSKECLPYLLSTDVRAYADSTGVGPWKPPAWFHLVQLAGAGALVAGIVIGDVAAFSREVPWSERRLGMFGATLFFGTLTAFLVSVMAIDRLSARYLVAIILASPFALAPSLRLVGPRRFAAMLGPYFVSAAVGGWLGNGDNVNGFRIRRENGRATDEHALAAALGARGLRYGFADYWVAYRLTFLFDENPILVPWHAALDRYPPYRRAVGEQERLAYVFDPNWSTEDLAYRKSQFRTSADFEPDFDEFRVGRYTVLSIRRKGSARIVHEFSSMHSPATRERKPPL